MQLLIASCNIHVGRDFIPLPARPCAGFLVAWIDMQYLHLQPDVCIDRPELALALKVNGKGKKLVRGKKNWQKIIFCPALVFSLSIHFQCQFHSGHTQKLATYHTWPCLSNQAMYGALPICSLGTWSWN